MVVDIVIRPRRIGWLVPARKVRENLLTIAFGILGRICSHYASFCALRPDQSSTWMLASPAHCWSENMVNSRKTVVGEDAVGFGAEGSEVSRKPRIAYFYRNVSVTCDIVIITSLNIFHSGYVTTSYIPINTMPA